MIESVLNRDKSRADVLQPGCKPRIVRSESSCRPGPLPAPVTGGFSSSLYEIHEVVPVIVSDRNESASEYYPSPVHKFDLVFSDVSSTLLMLMRDRTGSLLSSVYIFT